MSETKIYTTSGSYAIGSDDCECSEKCEKCNCENSEQEFRSDIEEVMGRR